MAAPAHVVAREPDGAALWVVMVLGAAIVDSAGWAWRESMTWRARTFELDSAESIRDR
jgi:hypothetical protein